MTTQRPSWPDVREALGEKVCQAFWDAVAATRADLGEYRSLRPDWVSAHSKSGLAHWLQDRLWAHMTIELDGLPDVDMSDREPHREIGVGYTYRFRVKRHKAGGKVETYPTPLALRFMAQGQATLDGLEEINLIVGYEWDDELREVGPAVVSLRDAIGVKWCEPLDDPHSGEGGGNVAPVVPHTAPPSPVITHGADDQADETGTDEE